MQWDKKTAIPAADPFFRKEMNMHSSAVMDYKKKSHLFR